MRLTREKGNEVLAGMKQVDIMNAQQVAENVWDPESDHVKPKVPTVQELLKSPLSKFIELAANDCGYQGSTQEHFCNYVQPLFLKAVSSASKEDSSNWWHAMIGPFSNKYWKAVITELKTF